MNTVYTIRKVTFLAYYDPILVCVMYIARDEF